MCWNKKIDKKFYLQVPGTSMGSIVAPNHANLFVGYFEKNYVFKSTVNIYQSKIRKWFRHINDIFYILIGSCETGDNI